jgi:hypothetical protein
MQKIILTLSCLLFSGTVAMPAADSSASLWNQGWKFHREAPPAPPSLIHVAEGDCLSQGEFPNGTAAQSATFAGREVRYVALEALSSQTPGEAFTSLAELDLLGTDGKPLPRDGWKVIFADSEETQAENGRAANILDGKPGTIWHTVYSGQTPKHPHVVVIDLGAPQTIVGLRCLPRQSNTPGMIKGWRLYGKRTPILPAKPTAAETPALPTEATAGFADTAWESVSLPHTPRIEPISESGRHFQGLCWYRKPFRTEQAWAGKKIQLRFEGAMQIAEVWLNGQRLATMLLQASNKAGKIRITAMADGLKPAETIIDSKLVRN